MNNNTEKELAIEYWKRVKILCKENKITQNDLCNATDIDIGKLKGQITNEIAPKVFDVQKIAEYFGVSMEFLVTGKETDVYKENFRNLLDDLQTVLNKYKQQTILTH